jgi:hypothetical protein
LKELRFLLDQRAARYEALSAILKTPERNLNNFIDYKRSQLVGAIKGQIRQLDREIERQEMYNKLKRSES